ncbi:UPF0488 protein C8orf33 homolog [Pecten maximus]|uniref:UPF0488 protein C8orf33 homolog n=1 Tax=Pecten maximus TaxID=6579 RepID=UPI0014589464|nr:UPF0488 protein C8orf33 homolog [Pecten maximus]
MADQSTTEEQFIRELHWCVEQLHLGLETQNPDSKQAREAQKMLKILCSDKAPVIKKRQVMRNAFGDYRLKMLNAEKKSAAKLKKTKMTSIPDSSGYKSVFYKKSVSKQYNSQSGDGPSLLTNQINNESHQPSSMGDNSAQKGDNSMRSHEDEVSERLEQFTFVKSGGDFSFGFQSPSESSVDDTNTENSDKDNSICDENTSTVKSFVMQKTENTFRFNFAGAT